MANLVGLNVARSAMAPFAVRREGLAGKAAAHVLYLQRDPQLRAEGRGAHGPGRGILRLHPGGCGIPHGCGRPQGAHRGGPARRPSARLRGGQRRHREHRRRGSAGRDRGYLRRPRSSGCTWTVPSARWRYSIPSSRGLFKGMERADSLAFDLHKWMYLPYDIGCTLVRDREAHKAAFAVQASYLDKLEGGIARCSGGFRGLRSGAVPRFPRPQGLAQLQGLWRRQVRAAHRPEPAPGPLPEGAWWKPRRSWSCLAPVPLNRRELPLSRARAWMRRPSTTSTPASSSPCRSAVSPPHPPPLLQGRFAIRVAITNHRSRREDFDALAAAVVALGKEFAA